MKDRLNLLKKVFDDVFRQKAVKETDGNLGPKTLRIFDKGISAKAVKVFAER